MGDRGRKSAADLSVASTSSIKRPTPPAYLSKEAKEEWKKIIQHMPVEWLTREKYPLFESYVTHAVSRRYYAARLAESQEIDDAKLCKTWTDLHHTESKNLATLGVRLRIARSTAYEKSDSGTKKPKWEK